MARLVGHRHGERVQSFTLSLARAVSWPEYVAWLAALRRFRAADLLRVKGFLAVEGCQGPVLVQFVQHLAPPPVELDAWPDTNRASRVVFITRGIAEAQVRALFAAVQGLA